MKRILLTGGRAPACLDLARSFYEAGHEVYLAESVRHSLTSYSKSVKNHYFIRAPRQNFSLFIEQLIQIIQTEKIDLLVPTCEEVFWVARAHEKLSEYCNVFTEPLKVLEALHNKASFIEKVKACKLPSLDTRVIHSLDELTDAELKKSVLKPVYSRFASHVSLPPHGHLKAKPSLKNPFVVQRYVQGKVICSYSIVLKGKITAHCCYTADFTAGQGSSVVFKPLEHEICLNWVSTFAEKHKLSGQLAFDFIETKDSTLYALECNPRATSGVHLFTGNHDFVEAFFRVPKQPVLPASQQTSILATAMIIEALPQQKTAQDLNAWLKTFRSSQDALWNKRDPLPFMMQGLAMLPFFEIALKHKKSFLEASTHDIEWNGN